MPVKARHNCRTAYDFAKPASETPQASIVTPATNTRLRPIRSERRPAKPLPIDAKIKINEKRLPALISERRSDARGWGGAPPSVATLMDGIKLASGGTKI